MTKGKKILIASAAVLAGITAVSAAGAHFCEDRHGWGGADGYVSWPGGGVHFSGHGAGRGWHDDDDDGHHGYHHGKGRMMGAMLERFDADADGALTKTEMESARAKIFNGADADADGELSPREFRVVWAELMEQRIARVFDRLDRDGDGALSEAESKRPVARFFNRFDRNDDGAVSKDDRRRSWRFWDDDGHDDDD